MTIDKSNELSKIFSVKKGRVIYTTHPAVISAQNETLEKFGCRLCSDGITDEDREMAVRFNVANAIREAEEAIRVARLPTGTKSK